MDTHIAVISGILSGSPKVVVEMCLPHVPLEDKALET